MRFYASGKRTVPLAIVTCVVWLSGCGDPSAFQEKTATPSSKLDQSGETAVPGQSSDINSPETGPDVLGKSPVQVDTPIVPNPGGGNPGGGNPGGGNPGGGNPGGGNPGGGNPGGGNPGGGNPGGGSPGGGSPGGGNPGGGNPGGGNPGGGNPGGGNPGGGNGGGGSPGGNVPVPNPGPGPAPAPNPGPGPAPAPNPGPGPAPAPNPGPGPAPAPNPSTPPEQAPVTNFEGVAGGVDGTVLVCMNIERGTMTVHDVGVERWFAANFHFVINTTSGPVSRQWQPQVGKPYQLPGNWQGVCDATPSITKFRALQMNGRSNPPRWWIPSQHNRGAQRCVAIDDGDDGRPGAVELDLLWKLKRCP